MEKGNKKSSKKKSNKNKENNKTKDDNLNKEKKESKKKHKILKLLIKIIVVTLIVLFLIAGGIVAGIFYGLFGSEFLITKKDLVITNSNSDILDKDGNLIGSLAGDERRQIVTLSDMPKYLPMAYVAIEDERFYEHHGVDVLRTGKAVLNYVFHHGSSSFGGSTITQQLVKNITQEKDRSGIDGMVRKIKEMSKAYQIEKLISKDQILELYLNILFVGGNANHGVQMGARYYFDKNVGDLALEECAFLAGINSAPNFYNPFKEENHEEIMESIKRKTKVVLAKMLELGNITQEEKDAAVTKVDEGLNFKKGSTLQNTYSYHTEAAIDQVVKDFAQKNGWDTNFARMKLQSGGYTIHTTQDTAIQARMEEEFGKSKYVVNSKTIKEKDSEGNETDTYQHTQAAMVIIDYTTGKVLGTVGGLGEKTLSGNLNRATQSPRQPGSATKPISTIAPAINEKIITAGTVYYDGKTSFGSYSPKNDQNLYRGLLTVRDAIAYSQNMIPLKIMMDLTPSKSIDYMRKMGVSTLYKHGENKDKDDESVPLAIGGISDGISTLEMAAAYGTIANDGIYMTPIFYTRVTDSEGNIVLEPTQEKTEVITKEAAYVTKSILMQPVETGTATYCAISGMDVSAKTGTTNESKDRWLCGFTPYYSAATWFGFDRPEEIVWKGTNPAGQIWSNIIKDIHKDLEKKHYQRPSDIVTATICKRSGLLASESCSSTYSEVFIKGTTPKETCGGHTSLVICEDTGLIANEECPNKKEMLYTQKPKMEQNARWNTIYGGEVKDIPTEHCTEHGNPPIIEEETKEEKPEEKNDDNMEEEKNEDKPNDKTNTVNATNTITNTITNTVKPTNTTNTTKTNTLNTINSTNIAIENKVVSSNVVEDTKVEEE